VYPVGGAVQRAAFLVIFLRNQGFLRLQGVSDRAYDMKTTGII